MTTFTVQVKGVPFSFAIAENVDGGGYRADAIDCPGFVGYNERTELGAIQGVGEALLEFIEARDRSEHQIAVDKMMRLIPGQGVPRRPVILTPAGRLTRARLIMEEVLELIWDGLGVKMRGHDGGSIYLDDVSFDIEGPFNMVKMVDGCFDAKVVITGTLSAAGIPDLEGQKLVDTNNLAKFGPGGYVNGNGKWVKPPNHQPPDLHGFLVRLATRTGVQVDGNGNPFSGDNPGHLSET